MSKRSKRRHRQEQQKHHRPQQSAPAAARNRGPQGGRGQGRGMVTLVVVGLVIVAAAVLYAVNNRGWGKPEPASGSSNQWTASINTTTLVTKASTSTTAPPAQPLITAAVTEPSGPKIQFATPTYDFGEIKGGESVKYTYVFTNLGSADLLVSNVQASCGCTTAGEWTRQVPPGKTGNIPIQFNSGAFSGQVGKSITVSCNDPSQPTVMLQIKGKIWKPIDVTPQYAVLTVTSEAPSNSTTVRIVNNEPADLILSPPQISNPAFAAELKTNQPGKQYELIVRTVPPLTGPSVQGQITMKTSSTNLPVINISAWANVQQAVAVMPAQISLGRAPLTNRLPYNVSIRNNATNALVLTEPTVNAKGAEVQLKEIQPGRFFSLAVTFPAGFELAQGEKAEVSVKSNHPQFPVIKVPIVQPPPVSPVAPKPTPVVLRTNSAVRVN